MNTRRALATDLDGTFIGDEPAMSELWRLLDDAGIVVVFATGRHLSSIEDFYKEIRTGRRAEALVAMVGTEIWHRRYDDYVLDEPWRDHLSESWDRGRVEAVMSDVTNAAIQPDEWQSPFKASYYFEAAAEAQIAEIRHGVAAAGLEVKIVYSADRFLDLIPARSGKGEAVRYLAHNLSITPESVITAGDTGNDLDMMRPELGFRSVVVGNATHDLRAHAPASAYRAASAFAAGIREGLEHYGWL